MSIGIITIGSDSIKIVEVCQKAVNKLSCSVCLQLFLSFTLQYSFEFPQLFH